MGCRMNQLKVLLVSVFLVVSGAALAQQVRADRSVQPGTRSADRITREVRHELVMLPYYGVFDNLAYRVDGNTVTLVGQVTKPTLKSDAEHAVKDIEGVEQVKNEIQVLPLSPAD